MIKMHRLYRFVIVLCLCVFVFGCKNQQTAFSYRDFIDESNFVQVRIDDGIAGYGATVIFLTFEGIIISSGGVVTFVPIYDLDCEKIIRLQKFIDISGLFHYTADIERSNDFNFMRPIRITLLDNRGNINFIEYNKYSKEIEELKEILIELIPEEYCESISFRIIKK